jgi:dTDP-4-dehydrorhamnose reductase
LSIWPRILITGAGGQVGQELQRSFAGISEVIACDRSTLDLAAPDQIRRKVRDAAPDIILNAGAYTAVDRAESEKELAFAINARAPGILAEEAIRASALLVHYSTDYVFDGSKAGPWVETDQTNPLNVYGASKLAGEEAIRHVGGRYLIFRTSWVYGPEGKNFVLTMLRLGRERESLNVVDDQIGAPTSSIELAAATCTIASGILSGQFSAAPQCSGIYNMTCAGTVSWCGFARAIFERASQLLQGKSPKVNPIPSSEFPAPAKRPMNSVLSNEKLYKQFGVRLASWESALDEVLKRIPAPPRQA